MPNTIKYSVSTQTLALKKGNFWIGTGDSDKGPTSTTGYWNGITPPPAGYSIYVNKAADGPSIFQANNDTDLIYWTKELSGQTFATGPSALNWYNSQTDKMVFNIDYPIIPTNGLTFTVDAGFTPSYPRGGSAWYTLGPVSTVGSLLNGTAWTSATGGSMIFDGADDYVSFPLGSPFDLGGSQFSLSVCFNPSLWNQQWQAIFTKGDTSWRIHRYSSGSPTQIAFGTSGLSVTDTFTSTTFPTGRWYNVTCIYDGSSKKIYVNGLLDSNVSVTGTMANNSFLPVIGTNSQQVGRNFNGQISVAQVYNRALTQSEVIQNYQGFLPRFLNQNIVASGMIAYWDAGYIPSYPGSGTSWYNVAGTSGSNGTLTNGTTYSTGAGGYLAFAGDDDYVSVPNFIGSLTTFSVSHFIYLNVSQTTRTIFSNYGLFNLGWVTGISDIQNNVFKFYLGNTVHLYSNTILSNLTWYNVTVTYNNGNPKIYINGVLDASSSQNLTPAASYYGNDIGRLGIGSQYFNGRIANVQVYNRELSSSDVLQNFNAQKSRFGL